MGFTRVLFLPAEIFELDISRILSVTFVQCEMSGATSREIAWTFAIDIWLKTRILHLTFGFSRVLLLPAEIFELDISRILSLTFVQCEMSGATSREIALDICN